MSEVLDGFSMRTEFYVDTWPAYSYVQSILPFAIQSGNVCRFVILCVEFLQD